MSAPHIILASLPSLCQKLSVYENLTVIAKIILTVFLTHSVVNKREQTKKTHTAQKNSAKLTSRMYTSESVSTAADIRLPASQYAVTLEDTGCAANAISNI